MWRIYTGDKFSTHFMSVLEIICIINIITRKMVNEYILNVIFFSTNLYNWNN